MTFQPDRSSDGPAPTMPQSSSTSIYSQTPEQKRRKVKSRNVGIGGEVPEDAPEPTGLGNADPRYTL